MFVCVLWDVVAVGWTWCDMLLDSGIGQFSTATVNLIRHLYSGCVQFGRIHIIDSSMLGSEQSVLSACEADPNWLVLKCAIQFEVGHNLDISTICKCVCVNNVFVCILCVSCLCPV